MKKLYPLPTFACGLFLSACAQTPFVKPAAATASPTQAAPVPSEFKASMVAALVLETGLAGMLEGAKYADSAFMPPFFRYSLQVRTTGPRCSKYHQNGSDTIEGEGKYCSQRAQCRRTLMHLLLDDCAPQTHFSGLRKPCSSARHGRFVTCIGII